MDTPTATAGRRTRDLRTEVASLRIDENRRMRRPRSALWVVAAILLMAAFVGWRWIAGTRVPIVQTAAVTVRGTRVGDETVLNASGYVTARRRATVSSRVTGKISEVLVEEGVPVREGQVLARLDDSIAGAALALAEAQLTAARSDLDEIQVRLGEAQVNHARQRRLAAAGLVSAADLDTTGADMDALTARLGAVPTAVSVAGKQVALRRVDVADTVVHAPFDGVAISQDAQAGEMLSPVSAGGGFTRTVICTIVDMSSLEIQVDVNEAYINRVSRGAMAPSRPSVSFSGHWAASPVTSSRPIGTRSPPSYPPQSGSTWRSTRPSEALRGADIFVLHGR